MKENKKIYGIEKIQNSAAIKQPQVVELPKYNSYDYWPFGIDNQFPDDIAFLNRTSPTHMGILSAKERYFAAKTIELKHTNKIINSWFDKPNSKSNYTQTDFRKDFFKSWDGVGNLFIEVVIDPKKSFINTYVKDYTQCRLGSKKYEGTVLIFDKWKFFSCVNNEVKILPLFPMWTKMEDGNYHTCYYLHNKQAGYSPYGLPDWLGGLDCADTTKGINTWNKSRVKNGFSMDGAFLAEFDSPNEADLAEEKYKAKKAGDENAGGVIFIKKGVGGNPAEFVQFNRTNDGEFQTLRDISVTDLITAHGWFRSLCSIPDNTGFETNRILNEYYMALPSQILPAQEFFINVMNNLFKEVLNLEIKQEYQFVNVPPLKDKAVMKVWEVRKEQGMDFDESDPAQQMYYSELGKQRTTV